MKVLKLLFVLVALMSSVSLVKANDNVAYRDANVRFTVISDGVLRMEYSPSGQFIDDKSFLAVNRDYEASKYVTKKSGKWVEITTSKMKLRYLTGSGAFTEKNLSITSVKGAFKFAWKPGMKAAGNLKGTSRTLDGYSGDRFCGNGNDADGSQRMVLEDGVLSTDGWTLIDDSKNFLFDNSDWQWVTTRKEADCQDWYFMAYGTDYKGALKDFTRFAGKAPLPPRYAFGYWWSRYWSYSDNEMRELVNKFRNYDIPLDVLVVDMDWHYVEEGKGGWTGYTWNRRLFPDPNKFLGYLKSENLQITLNLHPAGGVEPYEEKYPEMAKWMGIDPASKKKIETVLSDKRYMQGWFDIILKPMQDAGVDFWWLDWQQHMYDPVIKNLHNTWWINYAVFSNMERTSEARPMLYHRWGGLGNHRYQIGFSGDSYHDWESLAFLPYFTSTASNVLYGYWSHDLGGHQFFRGKKKLDNELFIRWMQFGVFSPIMRTHSSKTADMNKEPWVFADNETAVIREAVNLRYKIAPYVYSMARKTHDEGLSLCRPMYYDYPTEKVAYEQSKNQYMFGDDMLFAPVISPADSNGLATATVWLPAGNDWYEWTTGTMLTGGQSVTRQFTLGEIPIYVKAASILPFYGKVKNLRHNDEAIELTLFPGNGEAQFSIYEDNGNDKKYETEFATTQVTSSRRDKEATVKIAPRVGKYNEMPSTRDFALNVICSDVPVSVTVDGVKADYIYEGNELTLKIAMPALDPTKSHEVVVSYAGNGINLADGTIAKFRKVQKATVGLKYKWAGIDLIEDLGNLESAGMAITYHPEKLAEIITTFRKNYDRLPELLKQQKVSDETGKWFLKEIQFGK